MFWISYCVTFVLASAIAIALTAIRLVLSAVGRAFGSYGRPSAHRLVGGYFCAMRRVIPLRDGEHLHHTSAS